MIDKVLSLDKSIVDKYQIVSEELFYCPHYSYFNQENELIGIYRGQMKEVKGQKCVKEGFGQYVDMQC